MSEDALRTDTVTGKYIRLNTFRAMDGKSGQEDHRLASQVQWGRAPGEVC